MKEMKIKSFEQWLKSKNLFDLLVICLISLVIVLMWFRNGMLIAREESGFFFANAERWVYHSSFSWWDVEATGFENPQVIAFIPYQFVMWVLNSSGLSEVSGQAITLFFLLAASGISMYALTKYLVGGKTGRLAGVAAGVFYMLLQNASRNV